MCECQQLDDDDREPAECVCEHDEEEAFGEGHVTGLGGGRVPPRLHYTAEIQIKNRYNHYSFQTGS